MGILLWDDWAYHGHTFGKPPETESSVDSGAEREQTALESGLEMWVAEREKLRDPLREQSKKR